MSPTGVYIRYPLTTSTMENSNTLKVRRIVAWLTPPDIKSWWCEAGRTARSWYLLVRLLLRSVLRTIRLIYRTLQLALHLLTAPPTRVGRVNEYKKSSGLDVQPFSVITVSFGVWVVLSSLL